MYCLDLASEEVSSDGVSIGAFINNPFAFISDFECLTHKALFRTLLTENCLYPLEMFDDTVPDWYNNISLRIILPRLQQMVDATSEKVSAQFDRFAEAYHSLDPIEVKAAFDVQIVSEAFYSFDADAKRDAPHIVVFKENDTLVYRFPDLRLTRTCVETFLQEKVEPHSMSLPNYFYGSCK